MSVLSRIEAAELLKTTNIDLDFPGDQLELVLNDIQGNILNSHGRNYSIYLLLKFNSDDKVVKKWISEFSEKYVSSAMKQWEDRKLFQKFLLDEVTSRASTSDENKLDENQLYKEKLKEYKLRDLQLSETRNTSTPNLLFANFFLSFKGYVTLGLAENKKKEFKDNSFRYGMKHESVQKFLEDDINNWKPEYKEDIDALILLADDDSSNLCNQAKEILNEIEAKKVANVVKIEAGFVRRNGEGQPIEPFGFRDGISQPLFFKKDIDRARIEGDFSDWDPRATLGLVLDIDPFGQQFKDPSKGEYSFGSYCVYRKLQQDVDRFKDQEQELAKKLNVSEELAGAFIMGRFKDGRPVALYGTTESENPILDDFNYRGDFNSGMKCPLHAHLRKVNPRGKEKNEIVKVSPGYNFKPEEQRRLQIVRRGVTYGISKEPQTNSNWQNYQELLEELQVKLEKDEEGLLFLCFQSNITTQFQQIQIWANAKDFGPKDVKNIGIDPVIGQGIDKDKADQQWPKEWGKEEKEPFNFSNCVTTKGGEYFFAPSLSFLKSLNADSENTADTIDN